MFGDDFIMGEADNADYNFSDISVSDVDRPNWFGKILIWIHSAMEWRPPRCRINLNTILHIISFSTFVLTSLFMETAYPGFTMGLNVFVLGVCILGDTATTYSHARELRRTQEVLRLGRLQVRDILKGVSLTLVIPAVCLVSYLCLDYFLPNELKVSIAGEQVNIIAAFALVLGGCISLVQRMCIGHFLGQLINLDQIQINLRSSQVSILHNLAIRGMERELLVLARLNVDLPQEKLEQIGGDINLLQEAIDIRGLSPFAITQRLRTIRQRLDSLSNTVISRQDFSPQEGVERHFTNTSLFLTDEKSNSDCDQSLPTSENIQHANGNSTYSR